MKNEKISVIVPCYNVEKFIERCIESLKKQTYKNIEVLLIDDGSKDNTEKIINENIKNDDRFKYYYKENGGLSDARNFGLDRFLGEYVCFIDSDDYVEDDYIELLYSAIKKNKVKLSICEFKRIYKDKETIDKMDNTIVDLSIRPAAWNKMYHKSFFTEKNLRFPVGKWYEDLGTTSKVLFLLDDKYAIVNKPLYNYIQNDTSIMHTYDNRIFQIYDILESVSDFCKENNIYKQSKERIEFMYIYHVLIGTIFRSSFHKDFSKDMIKNIINIVEEKYPNWHKNKYIKTQSTVYRIYLNCIKNKRINTVYYLLKQFARYLYL